MVSLIYLALFGMFVLFIMAIVSNSSMESIDSIQEQVFLINCPAPIYNGEAFLTDIDGFLLVYNVTYSSSVSSFNGTFFECRIDSITDEFSANTVIKPYDETLFSAIPIGYFGYLADWISSQAGKLINYGTLIAFVLTPANFSVLGYGLDDIGGLGLSVVIGTYFVAYLFVVVWVVERMTGIIGSFT